MSKFTFLSSLLFSSLAGALTAPPPQPIHPAHPGSSHYSFPAAKKTQFECVGRRASIYLPSGFNKPLVLIAFGHGHGALELTYRAMFEHIARKGHAVLFVPYDINAMDSNFERMARDYQSCVEKVVSQHPAVFHPAAVIYTGHSNGALVASMAAGLVSEAPHLVPTALLTFGLAGIHPLQKAVPPQVISSFVVGDLDTKTPPRITEQAFQQSPARQKQMIVLSSYTDFSPQILADHGSFRTLGWFGDQEGSLHWHGYWKLIVGAADDIINGARGSNPWVYGPGAEETGAPRLRNRVVRGSPGSR